MSDRPSQSRSKPLTGRLAPSPTGVLHLGNARSFLLAWLDARSRGGSIVLRIEDLDGPRVRAGADQLAIEDLRWLGLDWDRGPVYQRPRLDRYRQALEQLAQLGLAYPCVCTRKDVEQAASAPHLGEEGPIYPGSCRGKWMSAAEAEGQTGKKACWRFAIPPKTRVEFLDGFAGKVEFEMDRQFGDFVLWKKDDEPAYQLAVVVDDADQGIDSVLRGDDLLSSAGRQILIYRALGLEVPSFAHVPLVVGEDGRRLAKRHGDTTLRQFRDGGTSAGEMLTWLVATLGPALKRKPQAIHTAADLIEGFHLPLLPKQPWVWSGDLEQ
jgi:glutamyl-tRNA synthetase